MASSVQNAADIVTAADATVTATLATLATQLSASVVARRDLKEWKKGASGKNLEQDPDPVHGTQLAVNAWELTQRAAAVQNRGFDVVTVQVVVAR